MRLADKYATQFGRYFVSVDCGKNTGIAIYDKQKETVVQISTTDTAQFIQSLYCGSLFKLSKEGIFYIVEDTNLNKIVFPSKLAFNPSMSTQQKIGAASSVGIKVGRNQEATFIILATLEMMQLRVIKVKPTTKKWDAETSMRHFPQFKVTNEHTRDALKMMLQVVGTEKEGGLPL